MAAYAPIEIDFETNLKSLPDGSVEKALFTALHERVKWLETTCQALRLDVNDLKKRFEELENAFWDDGK